MNSDTTDATRDVCAEGAIMPGAEAPLVEIPLAERLAEVEAKLGYEFKNKDYLERALTHRSMPLHATISAQVATTSRQDYERLEFLGDAVLDLAVAHLLLDVHRDAREGDLSKMRAALVNTAALATIARSLQLGSYIRLSRGELAHGGADRPSILADVVEAIIGAVYREAGFVTAFGLVDRLFGDHIRSVTPRDPKTELQETLHTLAKPAPEYLLECIEGPEHSPMFVSIVRIAGEVLGRGRGSTKKSSQQMAASEALELLAKEKHVAPTEESVVGATEQESNNVK